MDGHGALATAHWVLGFCKFQGRTWWGRSQQLREVTMLALPWPQGCPHTLCKCREGSGPDTPEEKQDVKMEASDVEM